MIPSRLTAPLRLWFLGVAVSAGLCGSDPPAMADNVAVSPQPSANAELIVALGRAADDAFEKLPASTPTVFKAQLLIKLAKAQIHAGDVTGARQTLGHARSITGAMPINMWDVFVLSVKVGDTAAATAFIEKAPEDVRLDAFSRLAEDQIKNADLAGAAKTVALVEALRSRSPREAAPTAWDPSLRPPNFQLKHDFTLSDIGKAFAKAGDTSDALALIPKISNRGSRSILLSEIAKAQHRAGDQQGADASLRQLTADADDYYRTAPEIAASIKVTAFGLSGEMDRARAIIDAQPLKADRDRLNARLLEDLARQGLADQKRPVAAVTKESSRQERSLIAALYPGREKLMDVDDNIARHDFAAAKKGIDALSGTLKDSGLTHLAYALAAAGQLKEAFATAADIADASQRAYTLIEIIDAAARKTP